MAAIHLRIKILLYVCYAFQLIKLKIREKQVCYVSIRICWILHYEVLQNIDTMHIHSLSLRIKISMTVPLYWNSVEVWLQRQDYCPKFFIPISFLKLNTFNFFSLSFVVLNTLLTWNNEIIHAMSCWVCIWLVHRGAPFVSYFDNFALKFLNLDTQT